MSLKMTSWAWETTLPAQPKLILMGMCDFADDDGYCFPSMATIEKKVTGEDGKSIKSSLKLIFKAFEKMGLITKETRTRKNGSTASNIYKINQIKFNLEEYKKAYQYARDYTPTTKNIDKRVANLKQNTEIVTPPTEIVTPPTEIVTPPHRNCDPLEQSNITVYLNSHKKINKKSIEVRDTFLDKNVINTFIQHRQDIKAPFTQPALDLFITKLEDLSNNFDIKELVNNSIELRYRTVYPPKTQNKGYNKTKSFMEQLMEQEDKIKACRASEEHLEANLIDTPIVWS